MLIIAILVGHALPIIWTFNIKKYIEMVTSLLSYLFYTPTYVNLLQIFAFCRIDDLSWGTKGLDSDSSTNSVIKEWEKRKYIFVLQYISTNVVISYICIKFAEYDFPRNCIILASICLVAVLLVFRLVPAALYLLKYHLSRACHRKFSKEYHKSNL
jgi:chitin synthase